MGTFDRDMWHTGICWLVRNFAPVGQIDLLCNLSVTLQNWCSKDDVYQLYLRNICSLYSPVRKQDETHTEWMSRTCSPLGQHHLVILSSIPKHGKSHWWIWHDFTSGMDHSACSYFIGQPGSFLRRQLVLWRRRSTIGDLKVGSTAVKGVE